MSARCLLVSLVLLWWGRAAPREAVFLVDAQQRRVRAALTGHKHTVSSLGLSPDGRTLATGSSDAVILWDLPGGRRRTLLAGAAAPVAWNRGGNLLATGTTRAGEDTVLVWSVQPLRLVAQLKAHPGLKAEDPPALAWSPDGRQLVTGAHYGRSDAAPVLWETANGRQRGVVEGGRPPFEWSRDGRTLATGSSTGEAILWNARANRLQAAIGKEYLNSVALAWSPDHRRVAVYSWYPTSLQEKEGFVHLWSLSDGAAPQIEMACNGGPALWSPGGRCLYEPMSTGVAVYTLGRRPVWTTLHGARLPAAWSPDGRTLATASTGKGLELWDPFHVRLRAASRLPERYITALAWSRDGRTLVAAATGSEEEYDDLRTPRYFPPAAPSPESRQEQSAGRQER